MRRTAAVVLAVALLVVTFPPTGVADHCVGKLCDSSGNGFDLNAQDDPADRNSPLEKYADGFALDGEGDALSNDGPQWAIEESLSVVLVAEIDTTSANQHLLRLNDNSFGGMLNLNLEDEGHVAYNDDGGDDVRSSTTLHPGFYTFTIQRVNNGNGTNDVHVHAYDGTGTQVVDIEQTNRDEPQADGGPYRLWVGAKNGVHKYLDGAVHELRVWDRAVDQTTLDAIADPTDRGETGFEATAEGTELGLWYLGPRVPSQPANPAAEAPLEPGAIDVSWTASELDGGDSIDHYRIDRAPTSGGSFQTVAEISPGITLFEDRGLEGQETYFYRIYAVNEFGQSEASATVSAETYALPSPPQGLSAERGPGPGNISLEWSAPANDGGSPVTDYRVYRSQAASGPFSQIAEVSADTTEITDTDLEHGTEYFYRVTAVTAVGEGGPSPTASAETSPKEQLLDVVPDQQTSPVGPNVAKVTLEEQEGFLCVVVQPGAGEVTCLDSSLLGPAGEFVPTGTYKVGNTNPPDVRSTGDGLRLQQKGDQVRVSVQYLYNPDRFATPVTVGGEEPPVPLPFSPTDQEWITTHADDYGLQVSLEVLQDGESVREESRTIPYVGQAIAPAHQSAQDLAPGPGPGPG